MYVTRITRVNRNDRIRLIRRGSPEIEARCSSVDVGRSYISDATLAVKYADERRVVFTGPIFVWKSERIRVVFRRVAELEVSVHRNLKNEWAPLFLQNMSSLV